ncbi:MAG: MBL fold metallo-hydrolase [Dehalococcoidales bacterium]|nr:MBL fold metallo-hydrolase [Dehalococcoidales bacterium]
MQKITEHVYAGTTFRGCNSSFVVTKEGAVVIDTPMVPAEAQDWKAKITEMAPIRYVINGEAHTDHFCGNCYLGGTLIGTEGSRDAIKSAKLEDLTRMLRMMSPDSPEPDESFYFRPPDIVLKGEATICLGDHTFQILSVPGHTPHQLAVYVPEERVVFTSDNINLGMPIFFSSVPHEWLKSLDRLNELDVDIVIPGHGEVTDRNAFMIMKGTVQTWLDVVGGAVKEGLSLEETHKKVNEAREFAGVPREGPAGGFFIGNVDALYRALKG